MANPLSINIYSREKVDELLSASAAAASTAVDGKVDKTDIEQLPESVSINEIRDKLNAVIQAISGTTGTP